MKTSVEMSPGMFRERLPCHAVHSDPCLLNRVEAAHTSERSGFMLTFWVPVILTKILHSFSSLNNALAVYNIEALLK